MESKLKGRTVRNVVEAYNDNLNMIRKKAWSYSYSSGIDYEDLMSEGHGIFMRAFMSWDGSRPFGTFLHKCLDNGFQTYTRKNDRPVDAELQVLQIPDNQGTPAMVLSFKDEISHLSREARHVIKIILNGPANVLGILGTEPPKMIRGAIQRYLVEKKRLTHERSWEVLTEIREVLS